MKRDVIICMLLAAAAWAVYAQAATFEFVGYDDPDYVTQNLHVQRGLTAESVRWAFTTNHAANWHPLTWLSHMIDCQIYGLKYPGGHHVTSMLFHMANTVLLYLLLSSMTASAWRSALVAALFALHPLHVESVAWISERKDLLGTFFGLLAISVYVRFTRRGGTGWYVLMTVLFLLSLMSKQMLVTLPFVLLLLDYWPLKRTKRFTKLVIEKLPLLAITTVGCLAAYLIQTTGGATGGAEHITLGQRVDNTVVSYVLYLEKTAWPRDLSALYTHPNLPGGTPWQTWQVVAAAAVLIAITAGVLAARRRYLVTGWLWYLGTLVPVIGLVQVGEQAMADRYTYVPLVGVFIMAAWAAGDLLSTWWVPIPAKRIARLGAVIVLAVCAVCAWNQSGYWRNSMALFRRVLRITPNNPIITFNLAAEYHNNGEHDQAIHYYLKALQINPKLAESAYHLGKLYRKRRMFRESYRYFQEALRLRSNYPEAHHDFGRLLGKLRRVPEAIKHLEIAIEQKPGYAHAHFSLGLAYQEMGSTAESAHHFLEAARLNPDLADRVREHGIDPSVR